MLIVNDDHLCLADVASLEELCHYCSRPLATYPLIMSADTKQTVYHVTCAFELATDPMEEVEIRYVIPISPNSEHIRFCHLLTDYSSAK